MTDANGFYFSSTTAGRESWREVWLPMSRKCYYQYDWLASDGRLFTCVSRSLNEARAKRDQWLAQKG